jgi:tetratricopeptide (TPR) repeat protein
VGAATPRRLAVLGRAQVLVGKHREAAGTLDAALARRPGDATAITYRAIARAHLGDQTGALKDLEKAAASLRSTTPRYGLGLLAYERHDLLKARGELEKALEHNSESFRARALLGRVLRDLGKPTEALVELERAERDAPALSSVHEALGRLYLDLGRDREARAELRIVLDTPGKPTADDYLVYTEATAELGLADDADKALKQAADAGALQPRLDLLKLLIQSHRGPKEALQAASGLEKLRKGSAGAHDARLAIQAADAWRRAGDLKRAGDDLRSALYGDALHANLGLGKLELVAEPLQAEASFRAALKAWEPGLHGVDDKTEARVGLARALLSHKLAAEAITMLTPSLTEDPRAPEPRYWLAKAYLEQNQLDSARMHAAKAVELDDTYAEAFLLVGELHRTVAKDKARAAYKKYLELQPNGADAKSVKKILANLR